MRPKKTEHGQVELFRSRLEQIINMEHSLVKAAAQIDWAGLEDHFGRLYVDGQGRPGLPTRLMVGLHYLKYAFDMGDETAVERFLENPYWQYFCGFEYFQHELPLDPTSLVKWRHRIGEGGAEELLKKTIEAAVSGRVLCKRDVDKVNVDTTVQEKAIAFPTDAQLYLKARVVLVREAKARGIELRQTRKLRTWLGRVIRDIRRKRHKPDSVLLEALDTAERIFTQQRHDKNKVYSMHAPEVECIAKGKAHKKYEFGCKASFVSTSKNNWIVGARAIHGNPYDGHTLEDALAQSERVVGSKAKDVYCDRGYRGVKTREALADYNIHLPNWRRKGLTRTERKWLRRRSAIEPIIGHLKEDNRLSRNHLLGKVGDQMNAILAACGFNLRKLLRAFLRFIFSPRQITQTDLAALFCDAANVNTAA